MHMIKKYLQGGGIKQPPSKVKDQQLAISTNPRFAFPFYLKAHSTYFTPGKQPS